MALNQRELNVRWGTASGTRAGGIMGVCRFRKPSDVYKEIVHELDGGDWNPKPPTLAMLEGVYGEGVVKGLCKDLYGMIIEEAEPIRMSDRLSTNADGIIVENGIKIPVEIKTVSEWWHWTTGCPDYYLTQVDMHMMAWDAPYAYAIAWCKGREPFVHKIMRDDHRLKQIVLAVDDFYESHIIPRKMPIDTGEACTDAFNEVPSLPKKLDATEEIEKLVGEFRLASLSLNDAKERSEQAKAELKDALIRNGNGEKYVGSNFELTFKTAKPRTKVDYKGISYALAQQVDDDYFKSVIDTHTTVADYGIRTLRTKYFQPAGNNR